MALLDVSQGMAKIGVLKMVTRNILQISFGKLWLAVLFAPRRDKGAVSGSMHLLRFAWAQIRLTIVQLH